MSDRYHSLTVVLKQDIRDDDAEPLIAAIGMMKGVISVTGNIADINGHMAEIRVRQELGHKLLDVLYPKENK